MVSTANESPIPRIPNVAFYSFVGLFWIYASLTRAGQWQLLRQALPKWGIPSLEVQIVEVLLLFPLLLALCGLGRSIGYDTRNWRRIAPVHLLLASIFGLAGRPAMIAAQALTDQTSLLSSVQQFHGSNPSIFGRLYVSQALDEAFQYLVLQFMLVGYSFYLRYRAEQSLRETLTLQYERARLQALRLRINPHFLYNTLNAIAGLVRRDPTAAERMVTGLGDLFRRTLADRDAEVIRLDEELEFGEQYLSIQKIRFSDRLSYSLRSHPDLSDVAMPPLLLQPLLENAVEHSIGFSEGRVQVDVTCEPIGELACITVRNVSETDHVTSVSAGTGFGLKSTRERMRAAFGESASAETDTPSRGVFVVRLTFSPKSRLAHQTSTSTVS